MTGVDFHRAKYWSFLPKDIERGVLFCPERGGLLSQSVGLFYQQKTAEGGLSRAKYWSFLPKDNEEGYFLRKQG